MAGMAAQSVITCGGVCVCTRTWACACVYVHVYSCTLTPPLCSEVLVSLVGGERDYPGRLMVKPTSAHTRWPPPPLLPLRQQQTALQEYRVVESGMPLDRG